MKNNKDEAVKEVEVVLEVFKKYVGTEKDIPQEVLKDAVNRLMIVDRHLILLEKDYNRTINELLLSNSLLVKFEQLCEMIGTLGTISVEDENKLDKTINILQEGIDSLKN